MAEWKFAERDPKEELAQLHHFTMKKRQPSGDVDFLITVREYVTPRDPAMHFYAFADKQTNQSVCPITPCGWGSTLLEALAHCMDAVRQFPYEPESAEDV